MSNSFHSGKDGRSGRSLIAENKDTPATLYQAVLSGSVKHLKSMACIHFYTFYLLDDDEAVNSIIQSGTDVNTLSDDGYTPLFVAAQNGRTEKSETKLKRIESVP